MIFLLWMMACSSEQGIGELDPETYEGPVDLPVLEITSPERGIFTGQGNFLYSGQATAGTWDLTTLELNGELIELAEDGSFSQTLDLEPGLVILGSRLEDEGGERAVDGRAVYHGPVRQPGEWVEDGLRLQIGPEMLDDDDPDLDDVASLAELMLSDSSLLNGIVGTPIETDDVTVTPTYIYYSGVEIDIEPQTGVLAGEVTIYNLYMEFDLDDIAGFSWLSTEGSTWMDSMLVEIGLSPVTAGSELEVEVVYISSTPSGFGFELDWVPGFVEDFLTDWLQEQLQEQISSIAEEQLPELIAGVLNSLMVEGDLSNGLVFEADLADVEVASDGIRVTGHGRITSSSLDISSLPEGAGSLITSAAAPSWPLSNEPFSIALDDDIANQVLFFLWAQGDLGGFSFSGLKIGALSGSPLPEPLGPADTVSFDINLPPVLSAPESDDNTLDMSIGEFRMVFNREDGEVLDFSVSVRAGARLEMNEDQVLQLGLDNRPALMTIEVGTLSGPEGVDPGDLAALIRLVMPTLLGNASNFLPDIQLPSIAVGDFVPLDELEGLEMAIVDPGIRVESSHWVVISTGLELD